MPSERFSGLWRAVSFAGLAVALGWPAFDYLPRPGLDPSWQLGLSLAHHHNLAFGDDVAFNYGPLGFVTVPSAAGGRLFPLALLGLAALLVLIGASVYAATRLQGRPPVAAAVLTGVTLLVAPTHFLLPELTLAAVVVLVLVARWRLDSLPLRAMAAAGALAGVLYLVKVSTGPVLLASLVVAALADRRRLALVGATLGAFVVALVAVWLTAGQSLADLGPWMRSTASVSAGHTAAMAIEAPGTGWEFLALALVVVTGAVAAVDALRDRAHWRTERRAASASCVLIAAGVGWFVFKQGFVRHDAHSVITFFVAAMWLVVLLPWRTLTDRALHAGLTAVAVAAGAFVVIGSGSLWTLLDPGPSLASMARGVNLVVDGDDRTAELDRARAALVAEYAVGADLLDTIGDAPVHVDPTDISLAWAYGLTWQPMFTLQRYVGYTPHLDEHNAESLLADDGPRFVVMSGAAGIDGRFALAESPRYFRTLLCRFDPAGTDGRWLLLERREGSRCGDPREVLSVDLAAGEELQFPTPAGEGKALLVSVSYDDGGPVGWALGQLYRPWTHPELTVDGTGFRMIAATSATPALLYVPPSAAWTDAALVFTQPPRALTVNQPATVTILEMEVRQ